MTREEVKAVLDQLSGTWHLMASLLYGSGLRLMEFAALRVKDVDFFDGPGGTGERVGVRRRFTG